VIPYIENSMDESIGEQDITINVYYKVSNLKYRLEIESIIQ